MQYKGVLTINDPCGRYMGLQSVARCFLTRQNIDISFLGPAEHPTAIVLKLTPYPSSKPYAMHMKADYFKNATPELFSTLLSKATNRMNFNTITNCQHSTYHIYYNNGLTDECTEEEFYLGTADFTHIKTV